jgi:hypothetical protein
MLVSVSATVSFETEQASFLTHSEHFQQLTPGHDWRRFSSDPRILGEQEQQQRKSRGIDPGRPMICTPKKFDILSRLQLLDRGDDELVIEPPLLTTVGVWVPSLAAAKSISEALRASAASGQLQSSFETRGLDSKIELLDIQHEVEPTPPPTPPPEPEIEETSDDESVRAAQVPKSELLHRLFSTGRGFRRLLYASFLQNSLEHVPGQRVVHVTEGPYMHSTFLLREPLWVGLSMRLALLTLMHPQPVEDAGGDREEGGGGGRRDERQNPFDFREEFDEDDPVWPLWLLPNAAALARKGMLREALEVAERELATNISMSGSGASRGLDPNFDVTAAVLERLVP